MKVIAEVQAEAVAADTGRTIFPRNILEVECPGCIHELDTRGGYEVERTGEGLSIVSSLAGQLGGWGQRVPSLVKVGLCLGQCPVHSSQEGTWAP